MNIVVNELPQGTVLEPLLFLAYINDMPDCITSHIKLFADDSLLYARISGKEDMVRLQDLNRPQAWEKMWLMNFHPDNCEILRIINSENQGFMQDQIYYCQSHVLVDTWMLTVKPVYKL